MNRRFDDRVVPDHVTFVTHAHVSGMDISTFGIYQLLAVIEGKTKSSCSSASTCLRRTPHDFHLKPRGVTIKETPSPTKFTYFSLTTEEA